MIVKELHGDILESDAQTLVCPVNTVGAMGKGLAKYFRGAYPRLYPCYQHACGTGVFRALGFYIYTHSDTRKILCLPTKRNWKFKSKIEWIDLGLIRLAQDYAKHDITSLAIPAIGCGEGGLDWESVHNLIREHMEPLPIPVTVYLPS